MAEKEITVNRYTFIRYNAAALQASIFLLRKYGVEDKERHDDEYWDKVYEIYTEPSFELNENREGYFTDPKREEEILGREEVKEDPKPKRQRKRREKNPLRRWIYEYDRYNPQLGTSTRKAEVYAKTRKEAEKIAKIICDSYNTYGYLIYHRLLQVSEPIIIDQDVEVRNFKYEDRRGREKTIERFYDKYPLMHSDGWDKLHDITEAD